MSRRKGSVNEMIGELINSMKSCMIQSKKMIMALLVLGILTSLSGCTLAVEEAGEEETNQDRLIGVFITRKSISAFDSEAYLEEHLEGLINGEEITIEEDSPYGDRIYADIKKNGSEDPGDWEFSFGDLEGIKFFDGLYQMGEDESFTMVTADDGISDVFTGYDSSDEGNTLTVKGTVYIPIPSEEIVLYANPVYQTPEGAIYTVPAMGNGFDSSSIGVSCTETFTNEINVKENGTTQVHSSVVEITYEMSSEPIQIRVHQMDENNQVVKSEEYLPGTLPEEYLTEKETAYIIVETEWKNPKTTGECTREIYDHTDAEVDSFEVMQAAENGMLVKRNVNIVWGE